MTRQATFNKVVRHLRKQKKQARDCNGGCRYLTNDGLKCAVGCLIPKKYMTHELIEENYGAWSEPMAGLLARLGHDVVLLGELQQVHDYCTPQQWERGLKRVATNFGLTMPPKVAS